MTPPPGECPGGATGNDKEEDKDKEDSGRTVACRLAPILRTLAPSSAAYASEDETVDENPVYATSLAVIEDAVQRVHRVVTLATEAIAIVALEDAEAVAEGRMRLDDVLPLSDNGKVYSMFLAVEDGERTAANSPNRGVFDRVRAAHYGIHGDDGASLVNGKGLSQLVSSEARSFIATLKTGLVRHYRKRVHRYCKAHLQLSAAEYRDLDKADRRDHAERVLGVTTDVCRPGYEPLLSAARDAAFIGATRTMLGLDAVEWTPVNANGTPMKRTLVDLLKAQPQRFLPGMAALNRAFAASGGRTFRVVPMRTALAPRFVTVDQKVLKELNLVSKDAKAALARDVKQRRADQMPFDTALKAIRKAHAAEKAAWKQADIAERARLEAEAAELEEEFNRVTNSLKTYADGNDFRRVKRLLGSRRVPMTYPEYQHFSSPAEGLEEEFKLTRSTSKRFY